MSKVAVWINNYGNAEYIAKAIESVQAQKNVDVDLYIFDNNSPKPVPQLIQQSVSRGGLVVQMPLGLAGVPAMRFAWDYISGVEADYSITLGGHDYWPTPEFLERLVARMDAENAVHPVAIVYGDTWQVDQANNVCGRFTSYLQIAGSIPKQFLPQFLVPGMDSPPFFGLWNEKIRRQVPVRYPCAGFDHLVVIEAVTLHGAMLHEMVPLVMQAPAPGMSLEKYGQRHLDKQRLQDQDRDFREQLEWMHHILAAAVAGNPGTALLFASMILTYLSVRGYNLHTVPGAYDAFGKRPEVQEILKAAAHIAQQGAQLVKP